LVITATLLGCRQSAPTPAPVASPASSAKVAESTAPWFVEVTDESGVESIYRNGQEGKQSAILESLGGGVGVLDFDLDGLLDLCFAGGGQIHPDQRITALPTQMYRNLGTWQFDAVGDLAGVSSSAFYSHGLAVADYNHDGFPDFLLTGYGGVQLFTNLGDGTFSEDSKVAALIDPSWSTSAGWADFNGDGSLDLYLDHYVNWSFENHPYCDGPTPSQREICPPKQFEGLRDIVFFSNGDGTFRDVTDEVGIDAGGKGLGVLIEDVDVDGDVDIYVANDTVPNSLYLNDGNGKFESVADLSGVAVSDKGAPDGSMGVDGCDFNRDGRPDLGRELRN